MALIALTGASGNVGRELLDVFGESVSLQAFTHSEHDDIDSEILDVTDPDDVIEKLDTLTGRQLYDSRLWRREESDLNRSARRRRRTPYECPPLAGSY